MTGPQLHQVAELNDRQHLELSPLLEVPWWGWSRVARYGGLLAVAVYLLVLAWG